MFVFIPIVAFWIAFTVTVTPLIGVAHLNLSLIWPPPVLRDYLSTSPLLLQVGDAVTSLLAPAPTPWAGLPIYDDYRPSVMAYATWIFGDVVSSPWIDNSTVASDHDLILTCPVPSADAYFNPLLYPVHRTGTGYEITIHAVATAAVDALVKMATDFRDDVSSVADFVVSLIPDIDTSPVVDFVVSVVSDIDASASPVVNSVVDSAITFVSDFEASRSFTVDNIVTALFSDFVCLHNCLDISSPLPAATHAFIGDVAANISRTLLSETPWRAYASNVFAFAMGIPYNIPVAEFYISDAVYDLPTMPMDATPTSEPIAAPIVERFVAEDSPAMAVASITPLMKASITPLQPVAANSFELLVSPSKMAPTDNGSLSHSTLFVMSLIELCYAAMVILTSFSSLQGTYRYIQVYWDHVVLVQPRR